MLKRLIRYDMKDVSKIAIPLFLASGIISIFCCGVLYFTFGFADEINSVFNAILLTGGLYFVGIATIAVMIGIVAFTVILRYYRSVFSDEGYLYMVIPVTKRQFLNSKIISSVIWVLACSLVAGACVVVAVILPTLLYDTSLISEAFDAIFSELSERGGSTGFLVTSLLADFLVSVLNIAKDVMLVITAITVGCVYFKRFRILISLALYFGITLFEEAFVAAVKVIVIEVVSSRVWIALVLNSILEILLMALIFTAAYLYTLFSLEKKLNLE